MKRARPGARPRPAGRGRDRLDRRDDRGGVTPEGSNILRFLPRTIDEDQWQSADRALKWLWTEFGPKGARSLPRAAGPTAQNPGSTLSARPTASTTCRPISPKFPGSSKDRRGINMVFPARQPSRRCAQARRRGRQISVSIATFGRLLCESLDRPYLQAPIGIHSTTAFLRSLGDMLGLDPEPFILREKHTTLKPLWDLWRSVTQDFFATASFAVVAGETYTRGVRNFLEEEMGLPCAFSVAR